MRPIIEFCANNMQYGTEWILKKLEENPDYDVIEYGCLGNCGQCASEPFALVNGTIIEAKSAEQLYESIKNAILKEEEKLRILEETDVYFD